MSGRDDLLELSFERLRNAARNDQRRQSGRTTLRAFDAIAKAIATPGEEPIYLSVLQWSQVRHAVETIQEVARSLGITDPKDLEVREGYVRIFDRTIFVEPEADRAKRIAAGARPRRWQIFDLE